MNFYVKQAEARRHSRWLVLLFALALLGVLIAMNFIVILTVALVYSDGEAALSLPEWVAAHPGMVVLTSLVVLAVVGGSSLFKSAQLASGGGVVARSLNGTRVERGSEDPLRRRLFNVVEEIAIASGVPLPEVYVLEHEEAINAFAAGYSPVNAAVAVTRGALEKLNRDELQGVIAHEFGHVLNGDMRLNTRLMGLIFGLLVVALIGRTVLRWGGSGKRKNGGVVLLAAFAVMVLGHVGVFFGRAIQAAVSRRREALADASAVQFTRDPLGLKGALVKIGGLVGSRLHAVEVDEVAHMLFAPGMSRLFDTHPPLVERIKALDPRFNEREFADVRQAEIAAGRVEPTPYDVKSQAKTRSEVKTREKLKAVEGIAQLVGNFGMEHVAIAHDLAGTLPVNLLSRPNGPAGVLLALALDPVEKVRGIQLQVICETLGAQIKQAVLDAQVMVAPLERTQRLPLLHETIPELRRLPESDRQQLLECLRRLILADGRIEIFEYALGVLARVYLQDDLQPARPVRALTFAQSIVELQTVFSTLAQQGAKSDVEARQAYAMGMHELFPVKAPPYNPVRGWPSALDRALKCLDRFAPARKEQVVAGLAKTISHDGKLTQDESELLRAVCAVIHCPLPPLMAV